MFRDDFDGGLDLSVWLPHYLPAWGSREATRASHRIEGGSLVLDVPVDHPVWCPDDHTPPLRVSASSRAAGRDRSAAPAVSSASPRG